MCLVWKTAADEKSRKENLDTEWKLNIDILAQALDIIGIKPEVDMFASRINAQFPRYASFRPDPAAEAVDSFSISWFDFLFYDFPPSLSYLVCCKKSAGTRQEVWWYFQTGQINLGMQQLQECW